MASFDGAKAIMGRSRVLQGFVTICFLMFMLPGCKAAEAPVAVEKVSDEAAVVLCKSNLSGATLDAALAGMLSKTVGESAERLKTLGFSDKDFDGLGAAKIGEATRLQKNLDDDAEVESIVHIVAKTEANTDSGDNSTMQQHFLAWLDGGNDCLQPIGVKVFRLGSCLVDSSFSLTVSPIHKSGLDDVKVYWSDAPECDGNFSQTAGTTVIALIEHSPTTIFEFSDYSEDDRISGEKLDPQMIASLSEQVPAVISIRAQDSPEVVYQMSFDQSAMRYRVLAEMNPADAKGTAGRTAKEWGNRCYKHIKAGRYSNALAACQKGLEAFNNNDAWLGGALYYNLGLIARNTHDYKQAIIEFQKSLEVRPSNATVIESLKNLTGVAQ